MADRCCDRRAPAGGKSTQHPAAAAVIQPQRHPEHREGEPPWCAANAEQRPLAVVARRPCWVAHYLISSWQARSVRATSTISITTRLKVRRPSRADVHDVEDLAWLLSSPVGQGGGRVEPQVRAVIESGQLAHFTTIVKTPPVRHDRTPRREVRCAVRGFARRAAAQRRSGGRPKARATPCSAAESGRVTCSREEAWSNVRWCCTCTRSHR